MATALFLAACGSAALATPASNPIIAPTSAPANVLEATDPALVAQNFYAALNAGDVETAMTLVAEDVKCRGECYLDGKESFRFLMQGTVNKGGRMEVKDLQVNGEQVSYAWIAYNIDDVPVASGMETLQIENGLIVLMETQEGFTPAAADIAQPVDVVRQFYELLNAKDVTKAMQLTARDYIMNDPFGTYDRAAAAV